MLCLVKITDLKTNNIHQVRACFYDGRIWIKNELANNTGLSLAATTNILQQLLKNGEIKLVGEAKSTGGRKSKQYIINKDFYHLLILTLKRDELNHYFIVKQADLLGGILAQETVISKTGTVEDLVNVISTVLAQNNKISVITLSVPGICKEGFIDICDFDNFSKLNLGCLLMEKFKLDVVIENDVNAASIGFGQQHSEALNLALMYQPRIKYVGCGLMINQQLCTGFSNFAGELSYLPFITHHQQEQLLKIDPNRLLLEQLVTVCCVVNPQVVAICSDVLEKFDDFMLTKYLPAKHCPEIVIINDLDKLIFAGLCCLGIELLKNKMKKGDN